MLPPPPLEFVTKTRPLQEVRKAGIDLRRGGEERMGEKIGSCKQESELILTSRQVRGTPPDREGCVKRDKPLHQSCSTKERQGQTRQLVNAFTEEI